MDTLRALLLVAGGGALGAVARWAASLWLGRAFGTRFPWATLIVNVAGCLAIGLLSALLADRMPESRTWRPLFVVGFIGAFTTFSTFAYEADVLLRDGAWHRAAFYLVASVLLGLLAVRGGMAAAKWVP